MGFFPFLYSGTYLLFILPGFFLLMLAQLLVNSTYRKWSRVRNRYGMTGEEAAKRLLNFGGLNDVSVEGVPGQLSDHYDPRTKVLRLSTGVAKGDSIAAIAVTAHEIGHALQDPPRALPPPPSPAPATSPPPPPRPRRPAPARRAAAAPSARPAILSGLFVWGGRGRGPPGKGERGKCPGGS